MNDGGPAFPIGILTECGTLYPDERGMSLRDYFAGQALMGLNGLFADADIVKPGTRATEQIALVCYGIADAMLEARKKQEDE